MPVTLNSRTESPSYFCLKSYINNFTITGDRETRYYDKLLIIAEIPNYFNAPNKPLTENERSVIMMA